MPTIEIDQSPATAEEIWAMLRETARRQEEDRIKSEKEYLQMKEKSAEIERRMHEEYERTNRLVGKLSNSFGELAEHLVAPGIEERMRERGFHSDEMSTSVRVFEGRNVLAEIDILLANSESVMAVEVKSKVHENDVKLHESRLEKLRGMYDKRGDNRKIFGVIAGAVFNTQAKQVALDAGFFVVVQSGDTMKVEVPEGFVPSEW